MEYYFSTLKSQISSEIQHFPSAVRFFLLRILLLSILWKCLYVFLLSEPKALDEPLTEKVGQHSAWVLNQLYQSNQFYAKSLVTKNQFEGQVQIIKGSHIYFGESLVMCIGDACNGLELFVLYVVFLIALPASFKRKVIFIVGGLMIIHIVNIFRCVGLVAFLIYYDKYFNIAHHYIFKMMVYMVIFFLWVWFSKKVTFKLITL
ncbi:MAG: hypothetical protein V4497_12110 [Bacteroidota bacterium]